MFCQHMVSESFELDISLYGTGSSKKRPGNTRVVGENIKPYCWLRSEERKPIDYVVKCVVYTV